MRFGSYGGGSYVNENPNEADTFTIIPLIWQAVKPEVHLPPFRGLQGKPIFDSWARQSFSCVPDSLIYLAQVYPGAPGTRVTSG